MVERYVITSDRLGLRMWHSEDIRPFIEMNRDPEVMRYFPNVLTGVESENFFERIKKHFLEYGYRLYAVDEIIKQNFLGFIGFQWASFKSEFTPCIEIGWRILRKYWNKGYATEGAGACINYGFKVLRFDEIFSFTAEVNIRSIRVMQKIGLKYRKDFGHPALNPSHELFNHVLFSQRHNKVNQNS